MALTSGGVERGKWGAVALPIIKKQLLSSFKTIACLSVKFAFYFEHMILLK